jgi:hypothetical protein
MEEWVSSLNGGHTCFGACSAVRCAVVVWKGAWNNGRANYRCHHPRAAAPDLPGSVFVREDTVRPHLAALLIRLKIESHQCAGVIDKGQPRRLMTQKWPAPMA